MARFSRSIAYFAALLVLAVTIVAKIPNSNCHCHEKKPASQTEPCPFGQLRSITGALALTDPVIIATQEISLIAISPPAQVFARVLFMPTRFDARAPPAAA